MLSIRPACATDSGDVLRLRHQAEDWLAERGIDQWRPREVPLSTVESHIAAGEMYVATVEPGGPVVAAVRLLWSDVLIWQDENAFAGYVHGLMIDRSHSGRGLGRALLEWAAEQVRSAGARVLRLDCAETNPELRRYYRGLGFAEVGRREFDTDWFSVILFEKHIAS